MRLSQRAWYDWVVEIVVGLGFLASPLIVGVAGDAEPLLIVAATGGMACGGIFFIAQWESIRSRGRTNVPEGKALIDTVDKWLREDFHRGPAQLNGYSHAIEVTSGEFKMWIGVEANRNNLVFIGARRDNAASFAALGDAVEAELIREIALEVARLGVYYRVEPELPFTIEFWDVLPVDHTLTSARVLEKVIRINQIDAVVQLVARQALLAAPLMAGSTPDVSEWRGSRSGPVSSQPVPNTGDYRTQ